MVREKFFRDTRFYTHIQFTIFTNYFTFLFTIPNNFYLCELNNYVIVFSLYPHMKKFLIKYDKYNQIFNCFKHDYMSENIVLYEKLQLKHPMIFDFFKYIIRIDLNQIRNYISSININYYYNAFAFLLCNNRTKTFQKEIAQIISHKILLS
jgi:hypothetical protein